MHGEHLAAGAVDAPSERWGVFSYPDGCWYGVNPPDRAKAEREQRLLSEQGEACEVVTEATGHLMQNALAHRRVADHQAVEPTPDRVESLPHEFLFVGVSDECTYRADGTDATYCGLTQAEHDGLETMWHVAIDLLYQQQRPTLAVEPTPDDETDLFAAERAALEVATAQWHHDGGGDFPAYLLGAARALLALRRQAPDSSVERISDALHETGICGRQGGTCYGACGKAAVAVAATLWGAR